MSLRNTPLVALVLGAACGRDVHLGRERVTDVDASPPPLDAMTAEPDGPQADGLPAVFDAQRPFPFLADFETGDLLQWSAGTAPPLLGGTYVSSSGGAVSITEERVHTGRFAMKVTLTGGSSVVYGRAYRRVRTPPLARYAAWFYLPQSYKLDTGYFHTFQFTNTTNGYLFDMDLAYRNGRLELTIFDHIKRVTYTQPAPAREWPTGRWVELAAVLHPATDETGWIRLEQDGVPVFEMRNIATALDETMEWNVGATALAGAVTPSPVVVYVDDCSITPMAQ